MSSIESKRVQYRKYLERAGVIDALSKALIKLYEEQNKPDDAIRYVRKFMCESCPDDDQFDTMRADLETATRTISKLEQELERLRSQIKKSPEEIREELEDGFKTMNENEEPSESLLKKYLNRELLDEIMELTTPPPIESSLLDCVQGAFTQPNSPIGVFAADSACFDTFQKLFDPIIRDHHGLLTSEEAVLQKDLDWGNADEIENLDPERKYIISTRIRVARNLVNMPFFPKLREKQYSEIEDKIRSAAEALDGELAGSYSPMSEIDMETQIDLIGRGVLFKRHDGGELHAAGCYRFWPLGRGIYNNPNETFVIWVNSEDHLRVISTAQCGDLGDVYNRLVKGMVDLEKNENMQFARHERYGFATASPADVGTGMHASVHIRLPLLSQDEERWKQLAEETGLLLKNAGKQNSIIEDGLFEVSNKSSLGSTEFEMIKLLQDGLAKLIVVEEELEAGGA